MKLILSVFLITLLLLTSCAKLEQAGFEAGEKLGAHLLDEPLEEDPIDTRCIERAKSLVSDSVLLLELGDEWYLKEYTFTDGLVLAPSIRYRLGEDEGENYRYRYPSNLLESNTLKYTKQQIAQDGIIKGDFTFKARLILVKSDDDSKIITETKYGKEVTTQTYDVVEEEIIDCVWP